jgi:hypothetical protein
MHSPHPRHKCYHKNRESHTDLLHQHIAFTYLLHLHLLSHQCKGFEELLPLFRPQQYSNQERAARLTSTRATTPLTCEFWQGWCSVTFSDPWFHHCEGSKRNYSHHFSLWPTATRKSSF